MAIEVLHDGGWLEATYPGDPEQEPFTVEVKRYDEAARLICARWEALASEMVMDGVGPDVSVQVLQTVICEAVAARVRNPGGEPWTTETVEALGGRSSEALSWLEVQLFAPFREGAIRGETPEAIARVCEIAAAHPPLAEAACAECLMYAREPWDPRHRRLGRIVGQDGRPWDVSSGKPPMATPWRKLGDPTCKACPRWDRVLDRPVTEGRILTAWHRGIVRLALLCHRDGHLPKGGGVEDQDPVLMDQMWAVRQSSLWKMMSHG